MLLKSDDEPLRDPHETVIAQINGRSVTVEFTAYSMNRVVSRGATTEDVIKCIQRPDARNLDTQDGRKRVRKHIEHGRSLDVVYEVIDENLIRVITVFFFSGTRR